MKPKSTQHKLRAFAALVFAATPVWAQAQISFTQHPEGQNVRPGQDVTLHVETAGPVSEISWLHDGVVIPGATGRTLTIPDFDPDSDAGLYHSVIRQGSASAPVTSEGALVVSSRGEVAGFPAQRSVGVNPWCPLCPHPPIIDPLDVIKPGTTTAVDVSSAQGVALGFSPASVDALSVSAANDKFTFSCDAQEGSQLRWRGHVTVLKNQDQGPVWQMQSSFEGIAEPGSGQVVLLANGIAVGDVTGDGIVARCRFFPSAVSNVSKKFDWAPKLEGGKEGYSMQFSSVRPVQVNGQTYQCDEVQFLYRTRGRATFSDLSFWRCSRDHVAPGEIRPDLTIKSITAKGNHIPQAILTKRSSMTLTGKQKMWVPANFRYQDTTHVPDPTAPYSPGLMGGPLDVSTDSSGSLSLNYTKIEMDYRTGATPDAQVWNEVTSSSDMGAEFACKYALEGEKWGLNGLPPGTPYPPALSFRCDGVFGSGPGAAPHVKRFCDMQQVLAAPGTAHPVRLHVGFDLADFTLEVRHQGQLRASYPCAGSPVINLPDWLKDLLITLRPATTATGQHIKEAVLTARIGEPLPQPWACTIEVNGVVHQGDELVFVRENLPAPAAPAEPIVAISSCAFGGGGGGAGKVSMQDFHFTKHVVHGHGAGFAFTSPDSPGLRFSRGLPPDFDDGSTVFDPFGPQPMALGIIPTTYGNAIKTKGTGASFNRIIPTPAPTGPGVPQVAGLLLPAVQKHAVNTKGTGANNNRLMAPSYPSASTGGPECVISYACDGCDSWEAELEPLMAPGSTLPAGSSFTLDAYGTVSLNGLPPGQPVHIGRLLGDVGAPVASGQPVTLTPDFSSLSVTGHRVVVRDASGAVVASQEGTSGPACTLSRLPRRWSKLGGAVECFAGGDDTPFDVTIPGHGTFTGRSVEILATNNLGAGPQVKSKTGFTCTFSGCDALALGTVACKTSEAKNSIGAIARSSVTASTGVALTHIHGDPDFDLLTSAAEVLSPRDVASGQATGRRQHEPTNFGPRPGFIVDCPAGGEITIDAGGAETGQFSLTRAGQTGPDCGVRCDVDFRWAGPAAATSTLNMDRSPTGACVLTPDFSGFGTGEIEVLGWSWGMSNTGSVTYGNSHGHGRIALSGASLTSPVWPNNLGACVVKTTDMNTCVMFVQFPAPCDLDLGGTTHQDIGLLAFVLRANDNAGNYTGTIDVTVTADEFAKVSLQDFHFRIPPPPISLRRDATGIYLDVTGRHTAAFASSDLGYWEEVQEYDIVENADGSICHHALLDPAAPRGFLQAMGVWKGWDGTVKGGTR